MKYLPNNIWLPAEGWFLPANPGADSSDSNSMIYTASGIWAASLLLGAMGTSAIPPENLLHRDCDVGGVLDRTRRGRDRDVVRTGRREIIAD